MNIDLAQLARPVTAPAKVNLNLKITGKRDDGYHLLNSAVIFTDFGDRITMTTDDSDRLTATGPYIDLLPPQQADNLCLRAIARLRDHIPSLPPIHIHLDKQIPIGAGLGGGSADAAAILRHVNAAIDTPLNPALLTHIAAGLGADVTVCLDTAPQYMEGIGDHVTGLTISDRPAILLTNPNIPLLTGPVFQRFAKLATAYAAPLDHKMINGASAAELVGAGNDLSAAAIALAPQIGHLLSNIEGCEGVIAAAMTGSGASCFGLFASDVACHAAAQRLHDEGAWAVSSRIL